MPHDMKGKKLKAGDKVNVPCIVEEVYESNACNVSLRTVVPMAGNDAGTAVTLSANQVKTRSAR